MQMKRGRRSASPASVGSVLSLAGIITAAPLLFAADWVYDRAGYSVVPAGPLDETAHIVTAWLVLMAGPRWVRDRFLWPVLLGSFIIDLDHVPGALGYDFLTRGTPRPYTHSLLTLALLGAVGMVWKRNRNVLIGLTVGISLHFFRDTAEGHGSGVSLLWPFSDHAFRYSHTTYIGLMLGVVAFDLAKFLVAHHRSNVEFGGIPPEPTRTLSFGTGKEPTRKR
jgi:inner membrane protein